MRHFSTNEDSVMTCLSRNRQIDKVTPVMTELLRAHGARLGGVVSRNHVQEAKRNHTAGPMQVVTEKIRGAQC